MTALDERPAPRTPTPGSATAVPAAPAARAQVRAGSVEEAVSVVGTVFTVLALAAVWLVLQLTVLSTFSEHRAQHVMYPQLRTAMAQATAPTGGLIEPGTPVAMLSVPALGLRQVVVEGTSGSELRGGPGHRRDTVLPGQAGISVVAGRAGTYGAPFARVPQLQPGQRVVVDMAQGRVTYVVTGVRRGGSTLPQAPTGRQGQLTLVTAEGSGRLAALSPSSVVYVDARATKAFPAGGGGPSAVSASELPMGTDRSALPLLTLSLAALLGAAYVAVVQWNRRRKALVWVLVGPVLMAAAWFSTDVLVRLLPNLV